MSDTKKMPFHLTITDNETGETVREVDFDALIGTTHTAEGKVGALWITRCNSFALVETVLAGEHIIDHVKKEHPEIAMLCALHKLSGIEPETEETETKNEE